MRLFIAIELPAEIKQGIAAVQQRLKDSGANANWTRPEGIHLTLKFLGEVGDAKAPEVLKALAGAAEGTGRMGLLIEGAGAFPHARQPRVLWLGVAGDIGELARLQEQIEQAMLKLGFGRDDRPFSPHLTMARIKFPKPRDNWQQVIEGIRDLKLGGFAAGHVSLMKSELRREGAVYTEIGRIELQ